MILISDEFILIEDGGVRSDGLLEDGDDVYWVVDNERDGVIYSYFFFYFMFFLVLFYIMMIFINWYRYEFFCEMKS